MSVRTKNKPWRLKPKDFIKNDIYAKQDWRFQMFFEYLRISPSYELALRCESAEELGEYILDPIRTEQVWATSLDMGNVYEMLYRDWWLEKGIELFGVHHTKPHLRTIARIGQHESESKQLDFTTQCEKFARTTFIEQGKPDSLIVSIPLELNPTTINKQLNKLLSDAKKKHPLANQPTPYSLVDNKLQYRRLLAGLKLIYMRAARPQEELWRIAARAKISNSHKKIRSDEAKKDNKNAEGRKMLTIMASRMIHDTLVIAENAATGQFPSVAPISTELFDPMLLQNRLLAATKWEKAKKKEIELSLSVDDINKGWIIT